MSETRLKIATWLLHKLLLINDLLFGLIAKLNKPPVVLLLSVKWITRTEFARHWSHLLVSLLYKLEWRFMFPKKSTSGGTFYIRIRIHVLEFDSVPFIFIHEHPNYEIMITHHVWAWQTMTNKGPFFGQINPLR